MSDIDFNAILDTSFDSIEKPKPLPVGTYNFVVVDFGTGTTPQKGTPFIELQCRPLSPGADVDVTQLDMASLPKKKLRLTFWMSDDARFRFKDFLEARGISTAGQSIKSVLPALKGLTFTGYVTQGMSDKGNIFNNIDRVIN